MALLRFRSLPPRERALVAVSVLIDGAEGAQYLMVQDATQTALLEASRELSKLPPETRMPLVGGLLRRALDSMRKGSTSY